MAASASKVNRASCNSKAMGDGIMSTWTKARVEFFVKNANNNCVTSAIRALCENTSGESTFT